MAEEPAGPGSSQDFKREEEVGGLNTLSAYQSFRCLYGGEA